MPINAEQLAGGEAEIRFTYQGEDVNIVYRAKQTTKEFKARVLRMQRESVRIERRSETLNSRVRTVVAPDGTDEAAREDEEAEAAIQQLIQDDDLLKRQIDGLVLEVLVKWDVLQANGKMYPIDAEHLFPLSVAFEGAVLAAVVDHATLGEASAPNSKSNLSLLSKPRDEQEIGRPFQNSTTTLSQANGALP